jgi:hypothetical protein
MFPSRPELRRVKPNKAAIYNDTIPINAKSHNTSVTLPLLRHCQVRFLSTLPPAAAAAPVLVAVAFLVSVLAVPFRNELITFFVVAAADRGAAIFFTTVVALPSLVSLVALTRRPARVAGLEAGAAAAALRPLAGAGAGAELGLDAAAALRVPADREPFAFSTMLERMLDAAAVFAVPADFNGEPGRATLLAGDAGLSRFASREFDEVGDRTWAGRMAAVLAAVPARAFFLGLPTNSNSKSFSLSPASSSLQNTRQPKISGK